MNKLPEYVKNRLITFLDEISVIKFSREWQSIQVAMSMISTPSLFKQGVHVYLYSENSAREPGCYNINEMSIKIWPHKIQLRRQHREYDSTQDICINKTYRYIYPSNKYGNDDFNAVMSEMGCLFSGSFSNSDSDYCGTYSYASNFQVETNVN